MESQTCPWNELIIELFLWKITIKEKRQHAHINHREPKGWLKSQTYTRSLKL